MSKGKGRAGEGETWIVQIDDKVELHKVLVLKAYSSCYELQDMIDGVAKGPKKIIKRVDVEFVEKLA